MTKLEAARVAHEAAVEHLDLLNGRIQALDPTTSTAERNLLRRKFEAARADVDRAREAHERELAIRNARRIIPADDTAHRGDGWGLASQRRRALISLWLRSRCSALPFSTASRSLVNLSTSAAALSCSRAT